MADLFFDRAFHLMSIAFDLIFCAVFHGFLPRHAISTFSSATSLRDRRTTPVDELSLAGVSHGMKAKAGYPLQDE